MKRLKIVRCKLPEYVATIPTAEGYATYTFNHHTAIIPDEHAQILCAMTDFYRIVRDVWREPLRTVLLVRFGGLGDVLLTTPLCRYLHTKGITVDYITSATNRALLENNPHIRCVYAAEDDASFDWTRDYYDAVVDLRLYVERMEFEGYQGHRVDGFFHALEVPGDEIPSDRSLNLFLSESEEIHAQQMLPVGPRIAYVWSTSTKNRNWTREQNVAAVNALTSRGYHPVLLSEALVDVTGMKGVTNLSGKLTIREAASVISSCDVVVSPDTGLYHVASALGKPVATYFGPFPVETRATHSLIQLVNNPHGCDQYPCYGYACKFAGTAQENACLRCNVEDFIAHVDTLYKLRHSVGIA
jgi:ADP-heptose:LPS heptosyltransferase